MTRDDPKGMTIDAIRTRHEHHGECSECDQHLDVAALLKILDDVREALPKHLRDEEDLPFATKVLAGNYAGAQKTNADFGAHIGELERACRAYLSGHTASEIANELKKESNGSPFALAVRALHWKALG